MPVTKMHYKSQKGFTIMELMVSITLITLIATVTLPVFVFAMKVNNQNRIRSNANTLATGIIEKVYGTPYEDIGNKGGSPGGIFDKNTSVKIDNIDYNIETLITWEERATDTEAFKNIKVTVKAHDVFTGTEVTYAKIFTSVSERTIKQVQPETGSILVTVKKASNKFTLPSFSVNVEGPLEDEDRKSIYTIHISQYTPSIDINKLPVGTYNVSFTMPKGYCIPPGETNVSYSYGIVKKEVAVVSDSRSDVDFYIDKLENKSLSFHFYLQYGKHAEVDSAFLTLYRVDENKEIISNINITEFQEHTDNFTNYTINNLDPSGTYDMYITKIAGRGSDTYNYNDVSVTGLELNWDGVFTGTQDNGVEIQQFNSGGPLYLVPKDGSSELQSLTLYFVDETSRKQVDIEKAFVTIDWFDDKNVLRYKTFTDIGDGQSFSEHTFNGMSPMGKYNIYISNIITPTSDYYEFYDVSLKDLKSSTNSGSGWEGTVNNGKGTYDFGVEGTIILTQKDYGPIDPELSFNFYYVYGKDVTIESADMILEKITTNGIVELQKEISGDYINIGPLDRRYTYNMLITNINSTSGDQYYPVYVTGLTTTWDFSGWMGTLNFIDGDTREFISGGPLFLK